jgi:hypothetical protein
MIAKRNIAGVWLGVTGLVFAAFVYLFNDSLPVIGLLWNPRLLPMLNMCRYLLAGIGAIEGVSAIARLVHLEEYARRFKVRARETPAIEPSVSVSSFATSMEALEISQEHRMFRTRTITAVVGAVLVMITLGWRFQVLPFGSISDEGQGAEYNWGPFEGQASDKGFVDGWAKWNFSGYEGRSSYGEYHDLVKTMESLGQDAGCGRALWENYEGNDKYGTTMALMLLPFWTDGCIGSSEGLFFEAAGTTPYHFLAAGAMSKQSSNPVRELRYVNNDAEVGVSYMRELGIRYYMAVTPEAITKADAVVETDGGLVSVASSGPWRIYEVTESDIVVPLTVRPFVVTSRSGDQRERWLELGTSWLQNRSEWNALPASDGPDEWQRVAVDIDMSRREGEPGSDARKVDVVVPTENVDVVNLEPVSITNVDIGEESVKFDVDRTGVPVLVRVSYFPNWKVSGAQGPYRVAPNMMVVVPTSTSVTMEFQPSLVDRFAYLLSIGGIVAAVVMFRRDRRANRQVKTDLAAT